MTAIITGATRGVGRAIAFELANMGYSLALNAKSERDLLKLKEELFKLYPQQIFCTYASNISVKEEIEMFCSTVKDNFKSIEVIVNNVGLYEAGTIEQDDNGALERLMSINLYSAYNLSRHFLTQLKTNQFGYIFNICSVTALNPRFTAAAYSISKAALLSFSKSLAEEMREYNVKVTAIIPGSINSSSWDGIEAPKEQFVQPDDISQTLRLCLQLSPHALIEEVIIRPMNKKL